MPLEETPDAPTEEKADESVKENPLPPEETPEPEEKNPLPPEENPTPESNHTETTSQDVSEVTLSEQIAPPLEMPEPIQERFEEQVAASKDGKGIVAIPKELDELVRRHYILKTVQRNSIYYTRVMSIKGYDVINAHADKFLKCYCAVQ